MIGPCRRLRLEYGLNILELHAIAGSGSQKFPDSAPRCFVPRFDLRHLLPQNLPGAIRPRKTADHGEAGRLGLMKELDRRYAKIQLAPGGRNIPTPGERKLPQRVG